MTDPRRHFLARRAFAKRGLLACVVLVIVTAGVGALIILSRPGGGGIGTLLSEDLPTYIGSQIVGIGNAYLEPRFEFDGVRYTAPGTVTLTGVALVAANGTRVIETETMVVTLGAVPKIGEPIVIEQASFERGAVRMLRSSSGDGFVGFDPFVKPGVADDNTDAEVDESFRLSTVLDLRKIVLTDIDIVYDDGSGADPLTLDALSTTLDIIPASGDEAGWYDLDISGGREPGLVLAASGRVNVDRSIVEFADGSSIRATLDEGSRSSLPGALRSLVETYQARGSVDVTLTGSLPLTDPLAATLDAALSGNNVSGVLGEYRIPAEALTVHAELGQRRLRISEARFDTLEGSVIATGSADLSSVAMPAELDWSASNLRVQQFLASRENDASGTPPVDGILNSTGRATLDLAGDALGGSGELRLRDGALVELPIVGALRLAIGGGDSDTLGDHSLDAEFDLAPGKIVLTKAQLKTNTIAARGTGSIGFDGTLDLRMNAGPLEKVQSLLGGVGDLIGSVTDRLVTYRVRGTVGDPEVSVQPLGIGD